MMHQPPPISIGALQKDVLAQRLGRQRLFHDAFSLDADGRILLALKIESRRKRIEINFAH